jgi:hypothetical protein
MKTLRNWWSSKTPDKRSNWWLLALCICFIAGGVVEDYPWLALLGIIPGVGMTWLEVTR